MPIEIRELVIRATIDAASGDSSEPRSEAGDAKKDATPVVEEAVRQVLEVLRRRNER